MVGNWLQWVAAHGYLGLFAVLAMGLLFPLPEGTVLLYAGYLVSRGQFALLPTWLVAVSGCMTGIATSYCLGRSAGLIFIKRFGRYLGITSERLERTTQWFHRTGKWGLLLGFFVPVVRHLVALVAGSSKLRFPVFVIFVGSAVVIWCSVSLSLGYFLKDGWREFQIGFAQHRLTIAFIAISTLIVISFLDWRRRRKRRHSRSIE
jgi:membrane protein DedA with SNARE-associated domain